MLSGDNGILQKATDAKEKNSIAEVVENAKLDVLSQIAENKGETISKGQLKTILNKYFLDIDSLELPDDLSNSDITLNANQTYGGYQNIALSSIYNGKLSTEKLKSGLYETGTSNLITAWNVLKSNNLITLENGNKLSYISDELVGDLVIDDEVSELGIFAEYNWSHYFWKSIINLTGITIPGTVTEIPDGAFSHCNTLLKVEMQDGVENILGEAFAGCENLNTIIFPSSIINVYKYSLYNTAWYNSQSDGIVYDGNVAFDYKGTMTSGTELEIREGTTSIASQAFSSHEEIKTLTMPNTVKYICDEAFWGCVNMESATLSNNLVSIGYRAFCRCGADLRNEYNELMAVNIFIPNSVKEIGKEAFLNVYHITYDGTATGSPWGHSNFSEILFLSRFYFSKFHSFSLSSLFACFSTFIKV